MGPKFRLLLVCALLCVLSGAARAETLRIQSLDGPGSIATTGLETLADELRAASGGEIDIEVLPVRSAVGPAVTLDAMKSGAIEGHYSSPAYFADKDPAFALLGDTLATFPDPETRDRWFTESRGIEYARKLYDQYGVHLVGFVYWPEEWLVAERPATIMIDFAGLRIRAPNGPVADLMTRIGAKVVALGGHETLRALDHDDIDAADWSSLAANIDAGAYSTARYAIRARHSMPTTEISVSNEAWSKLSPSAQALFEAKIAAFSRSQKAAFDFALAAAKAKARDQDVTLLELTPKSQKEMRRSALAVFADWGTRSEAARGIAESQRAFLERIGVIEPEETGSTQAPSAGSGG
jgi:TRAP-type C4-dicarboxylate transport system substrate-binding protein